MQRTPAS